MQRRLEMPVARGLVTAEEFERMPDEPGVRMELVRGRVVRMSPPGVQHAAVMGRLYEMLSAHMRKSGAGRILLPAGFKLTTNPDTVREPDLAFIQEERFVGEIPGFFPGSPDLAVEVRSPGDRRGPIASKVKQYLDGGVRAVWVVNVRTETVTIYRPGFEPEWLSASDVLDGGDVIPGFRCGVEKIFGC